MKDYFRLLHEACSATFTFNMFHSKFDKALWIHMKLYKSANEFASFFFLYSMHKSCSRKYTT